jgi:hypothetical protein
VHSVVVSLFLFFFCSILFPFCFTLENVLFTSLASGLFGVTRAFSCLIFNSITLYLLGREYDKCGVMRLLVMEA